MYTWQKGSDENERIRLLLEQGVTYDLNLMLTKDEKYIGGYKTEFRVDYSDVTDNSILTLPVIVDESVDTDEELVNLMTFVEDGSYQDDLKPEFS